LLLLLIAQNGDFERALRRGNYQKAVAEAPSENELLRATVELKNAENVSGVVQEVVQLRGIFKEPALAADWLVKLAARFAPSRNEALTSAGYLYLRNQSYRRAIVVLGRVKKSGLALTYLGDAYRRSGDYDKARTTLIDAARHKDAPQRYLQDAALFVAARLRSSRDARYPELLDAVGLALKAAVWLKEDAFYVAVEAKARSLRKQALTLFRKGLGQDAPAVAYWEGAALTTGDERFGWLVEAVQRGNDPTNADTHAAPGALLDLARECAKRKRYVAALSLAQRRLRVGPSENAWAVIESLPPQTRAPQ